jgi:hypothetical protein
MQSIEESDMYPESAMSKNDDQLNDLMEMEAIYRRANKTLKALDADISELQQMQDDLKKLSDYYGSEKWREDFEKDEQGLFPEDLSRGVLSEDGIYNLLEQNKEIMDVLKPYLTDSGSEAGV